MLKLPLRFALIPIIAITPFVLFFVLCSFLSFSPAISESMPFLAPLARASYGERFVPIQFRPECARYDARVTYLLRPGVCQYNEVEFSVDISVNSFGLRDEEDSLIRPEIVVLGDSHSMGHGVEVHESYPDLLERKLSRKVLNAAISSFGTSRELMLLRYLDTSDARAIVIQYCSNDLNENSAFVRNGRLPILSEAEYRGLMERASASYRYWLAPGLGALNGIASKLEEIAGRAADATDTTEVHVEGLRSVVSASADVLRGKQVFILELDSHGRTIQGFVETAHRRLSHLGLDITIIDVNSRLGPQDFYTLDGHMRASGHEKVASWLADAITTARR